MSKKPRLTNLSQEEQECLNTLFGKHFKYTSLTTPTNQGKESTHLNETEQKRIVEVTYVEEYVTLAADDGPVEWKDEKLMALKREINDLKCQLSCKDIEQWHAHTTACNLAGKILPYIKTLHVELCTQAWVKIYEILSRFKIVPNSDFLSIHLCEAPGAFISALNHYLQQQGHKYLWDWRATTLNPYYEANSREEMISDDRLFRHTYSQCYFGYDGSGDIRSKNHITGLKSLIAGVEKREGIKALLVTADGSRDCQENPAEQESLLSELHYCEMIAACLILARGGSFVLKVFTMYEAATVSLVFLLNVMFKEVHAFKPATSKGGNSETYLVCKGYKKNVSDEVLWKMLAAVLDKNITCFMKQSQLPTSFMEEHQTCCENFAQWQTETIKRNLHLFTLCKPAISNHIRAMQEVALDMFVEKTFITYSRHFSRVACYMHEKSSFKLVNPDPPEESGPNRKAGGSTIGQHHGLRGTFQLRQNLKAMRFKERIKYMTVKECPKSNAALVRLNHLELPEVMEILLLETAKRFQIIHNSQLCDEELLNDLNMLLKHPEFLNCQVQPESEHIKSLATTLITVCGSITNCRHCHGQLSYIPHFLEDGDHSYLPHYSNSQKNNPDGAILSPLWERRNITWTCSIPSPIKSPPATRQVASTSSDTSLFNSNASSSSSCDTGKIIYWIIEGEEEEDRDATAILTTFKETVIPDAFQINVINRNTESYKTRQFSFGCIVFMDLLSSSWSHQFGEEISDYKEILHKTTGVKKILWALKHICQGSNLILLTNTLLTRLSAGIVYILARFFRRTSIQNHPNTRLHQLLILEGFKGAVPQVVSHLSNLLSALEEEEKDSDDENTVVEVINFRHILNDRNFAKFLMLHNNYLLSSFISIILKHHEKVREGTLRRDIEDDDEEEEEDPLFL